MPTVSPHLPFPELSTSKYSPVSLGVGTNPSACHLHPMSLPLGGEHTDLTAPKFSFDDFINDDQFEEAQFPEESDYAPFMSSMVNHENKEHDPAVEGNTSDVEHTIHSDEASSTNNCQNCHRPVTSPHAADCEFGIFYNAAPHTSTHTSTSTPLAEPPEQMRNSVPVVQMDPLESEWVALLSQVAGLVRSGMRPPPLSALGLPSVIDPHGPAHINDLPPLGSSSNDSTHANLPGTPDAEARRLTNANSAQAFNGAHPKTQVRPSNSNRRPSPINIPDLLPSYQQFFPDIEAAHSFLFPPRDAGENHMLDLDDDDWLLVKTEDLHYYAARLFEALGRAPGPPQANFQEFTKDYYRKHQNTTLEAILGILSEDRQTAEARAMLMMAEIIKLHEEGVPQEVFLRKSVKTGYKLEGHLICSARAEAVIRNAATDKYVAHDILTGHHIADLARSPNQFYRRKVENIRVNAKKSWEKKQMLEAKGEAGQAGGRSSSTTPLKHGSKGKIPTPVAPVRQQNASPTRGDLFHPFDTPRRSARSSRRFTPASEENPLFQGNLTNVLEHLRKRKAGDDNGDATKSNGQKRARQSD